IVQLIIFIVNSGCTKHMTGNLKLLCNFVEKYLGLNQNLFSVGQFCDADLEVAFWKFTCFVRDLQGNDLLTGNRRYDLYIISLQKSTSSTPLYLMAKASPTQAWLCKEKLIQVKICSKFERKAKFASYGLMWSNASCYHKWEEIYSGDCRRLLKIYLDFVSMFQGLNTRSIKKFLTMIQRNLQALVITVRTDWGTEFLNKTLHAFSKEEGIEHQTSTARTPEQNSVIERRNRTLVEVARIMLSASKLPLFFWAEAIATACYTQNGSIFISTHDKMAYHIINDIKPLIKHLHILDAYVPSQQELDLLFGPLYDEFFTACTLSVNKSSSPTNNSNQQDTQPTTNVQSTAEPLTPTYVHAEENNDNQAEKEHLQDDEFTNQFCTLVQEVAESSHTTLEAMANSAWIEAMQEQLHQFDRL
nr:hypothetical protein [Tanacetum cinerariifolium]